MRYDIDKWYNNDNCLKDNNNRCIDTANYILKLLKNILSQRIVDSKSRRSKQDTNEIERNC